MFRNLNDLNGQRTIHLNVDKMTYFSYDTFWNNNKWFACDTLGKFEYLRLCKTGVLVKYKQKHEYKKSECFSWNLTTQSPILLIT